MVHLRKQSDPNLPSSKLVIAVTGLPGAGKAIASSLAKDRSIPVFSCGDVVREEASDRRLLPTPENLGRLMLEMRREYGSDIMAKRLVPKIKMVQPGLVVVEGLRSLDEVEAFKRVFNVAVLAVHSPPEQRFQRLLKRKRSDDPRNMEEFRERDYRELAVGVGSVIALADNMIVNDSTIEAFRLKLNSFFEGVR
jgi:dephospho-CoA kinase